MNEGTESMDYGMFIMPYRILGWAIEVVPSEDPDRPFPVHQWNLVRHGIYNLENLDLSALSADGIHQFAFIFAPLRLKGASGSPGNPIAVR